jgi:23S rRNA (cytidine1920-2'-O)/16S rRNA (cytidine1409-2'-O)-methyltransferase
MASGSGSVHSWNTQVPLYYARAADVGARGPAPLSELLYLSLVKKMRLDLLVVERGLFATRQAAQTAIMDGVILVDGQKLTKPGMNISIESAIDLIPGYQPQKFVSRGGLKLEKALDTFSICAADRICVDIGASTGGFTHCLLTRKARKVYAVDVGYGQLDWSLRQDPRVVVKERVNARYLTAAELYGQSSDRANLLVADVSFISLTKILPSCKEILSPQGSDLVLLVKPQFEAGKDQVGKGGVVRSLEVRRQVIESVIDAARALSLFAAALTYSPIKGPAGNVEFLLHLKTEESPGQPDIAAVVAQAEDHLSAPDKTISEDD